MPCGFQHNWYNFSTFYHHASGLPEATTDHLTAATCNFCLFDPPLSKDGRSFDCVTIPPRKSDGRDTTAFHPFPLLGGAGNTGVMFPKCKNNSHQCCSAFYRSLQQIKVLSKWILLQPLATLSIVVLNKTNEKYERANEWKG